MKMALKTSYNNGKNIIQPNSAQAEALFELIQKSQLQRGILTYNEVVYIKKMGFDVEITGDTRALYRSIPPGEADMKDGITIRIDAECPTCGKKVEKNNG